MNSDVEDHIRQNTPWSKLPGLVKQSLGNSQKEYEKVVVEFSVKNQLRYKGNIVKTFRKDERRYYEELLCYSREHLMLYPYHLSDVVVRGLRVTPFSYYIDIMSSIMTQEKSYDSLPNFTAADCLRLLGIGRNQYIDLMNQNRSSKKFFRRKPVRELLPIQPVDSVSADHWWIVNIGYITEDDIKMCHVAEKEAIDKVIDCGPQLANDVDYKVLHGLYRKGLVYLDVPIADDDCIVVPPLQGFVMNRVLGDYFETLLYKIFVSIDEHTTVAELASILEIDLQLVKNAVSMFCRLGFAHKKMSDLNLDDLHTSWRARQTLTKKPSQDQLLLEMSMPITETESLLDVNTASNTDSSSIDSSLEVSCQNVGSAKRIVFLFDSTLTAFLMMGNLSQGLKSHAVTMFEVGKLSDESMDSFLTELEKVGSEAEGEAQRYFDHAVTLRHTIRFLRYNKNLFPDSNANSQGLGIDLIRCESLLSLDAATRARILNKNYTLLVSMAPLSYEVKPVCSCTPQHIGPTIPEVNSVWFKLFIYHLTGNGPPSVLLVKGTKLRRLPAIFQEYDRLLVTTWDHDPGVIASSNILMTLNDALSHSAVLIQAHGWETDGNTIFVPFPLNDKNGYSSSGKFSVKNSHYHKAIQKLSKSIDLQHTCGYMTLLNIGKPVQSSVDVLEASLSQNLILSDTDSDLKCDEKELNITSFDNSFSHELTNLQHSDAPCNGIKNQACADILSNELDNLQTEQMDHNNIARDNLTLNIIPPSEQDQDESSVEDSEDTWLLLDCFFGIPLFESKLNEEVCQRVASGKLCTNESLEKLLHSSRKLSLRLLTFISHFQGKNGNQELNGATPETEYKMCSDPRQNLIFSKGRLEKWDGR
ncbi:protein FAM91A1-like [Argonauta hians]